MAEDSFQEKTEQATPRKLQKSREEGQVVKSIEIQSVLVLLSGLLALYGFGFFYYKELLSVMRHSFIFHHIPEMNLSQCVTLIQKFGFRALIILSPIFTAVFIMALLSGFVQVGFVIALKAIEPSWSKMSMIKGFERLFSSKSFFEAFKSIFKLTVIGLISWYIVKGETSKIKMLYSTNIDHILLYTLRVAFKIFFWVIIVMIFLALLDYLFQRWQFMNQMKMTKQEVKEESKQSEGDPQVKSRIKTLQYQAARKRMMQEVPKSDVVVTNPTHLAIAIQYDASKMNVPKVVAKGAGLIAERIKTVAYEHDVPVVENKELAQNLYKLIDIGDEIPAQFFQAVAELLAYVYKLKGKTA
jgi:flagellar biosynthesis protein FlhB